MARYGFENWTDETGEVIGVEPLLRLLVDRDKALTSHYEEVVVPTHTLTISATSGGMTDPAPGSYEYDEGTSAIVTAIPDSGYLFDHWELDSTVTPMNPINVLMDADHTIHAVFVAAPPPEHMLTISVTGAGSTDPSPGSYRYPEGTTVRVTAFPAPGFWEFDYWELDGAVRTENPIDVLMDRDHTLHAVFILPEHTLTISTTTGGTTDPAPDSHTYPAGTVARITAISDSGYLFDHWELDGASRTENPIDVLMDKDHTLHAVFSGAPPPEHLLTISATEGGTTDPVPGSYYYPEGTVAMVVAYPDNGYIFDHWLIDGVTRETANPVNILMDTDHTVHAVFKEAPPVPPPSAVKMLALVGGAAAVMGLAYYAGKK